VPRLQRHHRSKNIFGCEHTITETLVHPRSNARFLLMSKLFTLRRAIIPVASGFAIAAYRNQFSSDDSSPDKFSTFKLASRSTTSSTSSIFTLESKEQAHSILQQPQQRNLWSVQIKQPQLQIARAYTPLPPRTSAEDASIRLLIRRDRRGEVSNYLHKLPVGAQVELRGPRVEYKIPAYVDEVVFLAGGTGIAPALQLAHTLQGQTKMSVLWANRKREECSGGQSDTVHSADSGLLSSVRGMFWTTGQGSTASDVSNPHAQPPSEIVQQLDSLKRAYPDDSCLKVDYFVDEEGTFITVDRVKELVRGAGTMMKPGSVPSATRLLVVSGPEGFVSHWAGPKQWIDGQEVQGPVGGLLSQVSLRDWEVVKL